CARRIAERWDRQLDDIVCLFRQGRLRVSSEGDHAETEAPRLYRRLDGSAHLAGKGDADDGAMLRSRAQVAYAVTRKVERVYTFGVNARKFLEGQRRCRTREGRVSTPGKIKSGNPVSMQFTRQGA